MHITRIESAKIYQAPNHDHMTCFRLQGMEAGPSSQMWMGMSVIEPGGQTGLNDSPFEKIYFVVEGELTFISEMPQEDKSEVVLKSHDSCVFAPGEKRQLVNRSNSVVKVILVMPLNVISKE